jgi:hypothetical protein
VIDQDIFDEDGALTAQFLLSRGFCCGNKCRNCPYEPRHGGPAAKPPAVVEAAQAPSDDHAEARG